MNPSYVLLVALLIATTAAIYGTYIYMLNMAENFHTEDIATAIKTLLNLEPGQTATAYVAMPYGTTLRVCTGAECGCGAPTCIIIAGPTTSAVVGTTAEVVVVPNQAEFPAGNYIIKASAAPPDLERLTICRVAYQAVVDAEKLVSSNCMGAVDEVVNEIDNLASTSAPSWLTSNLLQTLQSQGYELCKQGENSIEYIYKYLCFEKKIYLEIIPTR
jgi:hypothetical protein